MPENIGSDHLENNAPQEVQLSDVLPVFEIPGNLMPENGQIEKTESDIDFPAPGETKTYRSECVDAEGNTIGIIEMTLFQSEKDFGYEKLPQLRTLKLQAPGSNEEIDILELVDIGDVRIFINSSQIVSRYEKGIISLSRIPNEPIGLGVLLHEIGHYKQHQDPQYKEIGKIYESVMGLYGAPQTPSIELINWIFRAVPDAEEFKNDPGFQEYWAHLQKVEEEDETNSHLFDEMSKIRRKIHKLEDQKIIGKIARFFPSYKKLSAELELLSESMHQKLENMRKEKKEIGISTKISRLSLLPVRIKERDANKRAFVWLREIRERLGVNLLVKVMDKKSNEITDVRAHLSEGVNKFHGANQENMRVRTKEGDLGKMPRAPLAKEE
jgi:hypothetical protein